MFVEVMTGLTRVIWRSYGVDETVKNADCPKLEAADRLMQAMGKTHRFTSSGIGEANPIL